MTVNASVRADSLYSVKQSDSRVSFSPVIVVLLAIGIVAVLIFAGFYAMTEIADISRDDDMDVTARVSGNDVMITVIGGDDALHVTRICAYIDGAPGGKTGRVPELPRSRRDHCLSRHCSRSVWFCLCDH